MIINSTQLVDLIKSNKRKFEDKFPELIQKLIRNTLNNNIHTHFPSNDAIFTPGWDGFVENNTDEYRYVPFGNSIFELGAKKEGIRGISKIRSDYKKRKEEKDRIDKSQYTYIAVTSSILNSTTKQSFCENATKDSVFKKVEIIDANDICDWLENHIDICIWLLQQVGREKELKAYDIELLTEEWKHISECTSPCLTCGLFTVGNAGLATKLIQDIENIKQNNIITISSNYYGRDYSFYFGVAAIISSKKKEIIERCIVVNSQAALDYVSSFCTGKIVLVNYNCTSDRFADSMNNIYLFFDSCFSNDIKLEFVKQKDFEEEVTKLGFDGSDAYKLSYTVDYNALALRRLLAKAPLIKVPSWAKMKDKNQLIPLLLMGEIKMDEESDVTILKTLVGEDYDSYIELLNYWSEMSESPLFKFDNIYRICARQECFNYLQVDVFSLKLIRLENKLKSIFKETNNKYEKSPNHWIINDGSYIWRDKLIKNILDGFIILANRNKKNQAHFNNLVTDILDNIIGKYELSLTISNHLDLLAELAPVSFLDYLKKSITKDKDNFLKFVKSTVYFGFSSIKFIYCVLNALDVCLSDKNLVFDAFRWLLDLYEICVTEDIKEKINRCLSPITTMEGLIALPLEKKIAIFFEYIKDKDFEKYQSIVNTIQEGGTDNVIIAVRHSYRNNILKKIGVTHREIFNMQNEALKCLLLHSDSFPIVDGLKSALQNIHNVPYEIGKKQLEAFNKFKSCDDETKALLCHELNITKEDILQFDDWSYLKKYIGVIDELLLQLKPSDLYIASKDILLNDRFPLPNPPNFDDSLWQDKEMALRKEIRKSCLKEIIDKYGEDIFEKIIEDGADKSYEIWQDIYEISTDHIRDISNLIKFKNEIGLKIYLSNISFDTLKALFSTSSDKGIMLRNMPYTSDVFVLIDGTKDEHIFWENKHPYIDVEVDFEYVFKKFIEFAPFKLLSVFAYRIPVDYKHGIILLKAIVRGFKDKEKHISSSHDFNSLQKFVSIMDNKYYTDELSNCEFELLPLLMANTGDYPLGIKKYFWDSPEILSELIISLYNNRDNLKPNSIGSKIFYDALLASVNSCYIPSDYLIQYKNKLKNWVDEMLIPCQKSDIKVKQIIKTAIINTLACCPKNSTNEVWPIEEIADILEELAKEDFDTPDRVSIHFYTAYANRRGVRTIADGSAEFALSSEFLKYREKYQFSHPVTSKALEYIAEGYNTEGEMDKIEAFLGE